MSQEPDRTPITSSRAWQRIVEMSTDIAVIVAADATLLWVSPTAREIAGYTPEEVVGLNGFQFVHPDDLADVQSYFGVAATTPGSHEPIEFRIRAKDGRWVWVEDRITNLLDDPEVAGLVAYIRDISDRRWMTMELELREQRYRAIVETADEGIGIIDSTGTIVFANGQLSELVGSDEVEGTNVLAHVDTRDAKAVGERLVAMPTPERLSVRLRHGNGRLIYAAVAVMPFEPDADGVPTALVMVRDDTARHSYEHELEHATLHDALTGLPNRQLLTQHLSELTTSLDPGRRAALFLVDIDQFAALNQSLGARAGDAVLAEVAMRLVELASPGDVVARIGGDQFAVLRVSSSTGLQARQYGQQLLDAMSAPMQVDGEQLRLTASVGMTLTDGLDLDTTYTRAVAALSVAKRHGRNRCHLDDGDDRPVALERWRLESELRAAVDTDELFVVYQPIVDLATGAFIGAEALLRWTSPVRGPVPPDQFIPIAEEAGLIDELGRRVLTIACTDAAAWPLHPDGSRLPLSVNISAKQLAHASFTATVLFAVQEAGLTPQDVVLEMTETGVLSDVDAAAAALTELHDAGVRVHVDDFGTGYGSMLYLRHFPVDAVKIDRQFVAGLGVNEEDAAIVAGTLSIARATGRSVIAEGVETDQQAEFLRLAGCTAAQGFLWSRPLPQDQWLALQQAAARPPEPTRRSRAKAKPSPQAIARITELHARGTSATSIAAALNREGIPATGGTRWHRASVEALVSELLTRPGRR